MEAVVPTNTLTREFVNMLFRFRGKTSDRFAVEVSSQHLRRLAVRSFLDRRYDDPPIGIFQIDYLEDRFRGIALLMVHGRTTLVATWNDPKRWKLGEACPNFG